MNKPTERAPLLSDEQMESWVDIGDSMGPVNSARDFYEAKITSGELRVVKKVDIPVLTFDMPVRDNHGVIHGHDAMMPCCQFIVAYTEMNMWGMWDFCPGCGAQIVKP